jgi:3-hydroxybutyryl-CoA dehydrogenase
MRKNEIIAVIGAGQMGSGIGQVFATAGYRVRMYDLSEDILEKSRKRVFESLRKFEAKNLLSETAEVTRERISYHTDMSELGDCKVVIESAFENFKIKESIFTKLSEVLRADALIATNTSSYSITALSKMLPRPEKFIGFHFMNPPPLMELIEIIRGLYTDEDTFKFFLELSQKLKKTPIVSKNTPGFVLNRILIPMINEAIYVLHEGVATPEQVDKAMTLGANHPIGPLALADLIGLDTVLAIIKTLQKELGENKYAPCPLLENYVFHGKLGKKTKRGFYEYES